MSNRPSEYWGSELQIQGEEDTSYRVTGFCDITGVIELTNVDTSEMKQMKVAPENEDLVELAKINAYLAKAFRNVNIMK